MEGYLAHLHDYVNPRNGNVASDSTHFKAWDQNIFTEWHSRHRNGKRGVGRISGLGSL